MYMAIKKTFDEQGIEIPFPHVSLYAGTATTAFPLSSVVNKTDISAGMDK